MKRILLVLVLILLSLVLCSCRTIPEKHWQDDFPENLTPEDIQPSSPGVIFYKATW